VLVSAVGTCACPPPVGRAAVVVEPPCLPLRVLAAAVGRRPADGADPVRLAIRALPMRPGPGRPHRSRLAGHRALTVVVGLLSTGADRLHARRGLGNRRRRLRITSRTISTT
jgi:hypothetical protein